MSGNTLTGYSRGFQEGYSLRDNLSAPNFFLVGKASARAFGKDGGGPPKNPATLRAAGVAAMKPHLTSGRNLSEVEKKFKSWVSGGACNKQELWAAWREIDYNGNGRVSLAEIDKWVAERFEPTLRNAPALMRAYKATVGSRQDEFVRRMDFPVLLRNIIYFNKIWRIFDDIDVDDDRRLSFDEFCGGLSKLNLAGVDAQAVFATLDTNRGGLILFDEFCKWVSGVQCPVDSSVYDNSVMNQDIRKGVDHDQSRGLGFTSRAPVSQNLPAASKGQFASIERQFQEIVRDKGKLQAEWRRMDFNGNGYVSLAEIDKLVVEAYPILDNKPALMRAYKATTPRGGDGFVHKREFPLLLRNIVYFNYAFAVFGSVDANHDRRLDLQEFQNSCGQLGLTMSPAEARAEFEFMDLNNGGMVLFDEFCKWVAARKLPLA